jgi:hypothetical protein
LKIRKYDFVFVIEDARLKAQLKRIETFFETNRIFFLFETFETFETLNVVICKSADIHSPGEETHSDIKLMLSAFETEK